MDELALDHAAREERERLNQMWTLKRNADGTTQENKNSNHPNYRTAVQDIYRVSVADLTAPPSIPRHKQPQQQQTWQTWWSDDGWHNWST